MTSLVSATTISASATAAVVAHPAERSLGGPSVTPATSQTTTSSKISTVAVAFIPVANHPFVSHTTAPPQALDFAMVAPPPLPSPTLAARAPGVDAEAPVNLRSPKTLAAEKTAYFNWIRGRQTALLNRSIEDLRCTWCPCGENA